MSVIKNEELRQAEWEALQKSLKYWFDNQDRLKKDAESLLTPDLEERVKERIEKLREASPHL